MNLDKYIQDKSWLRKLQPGDLIVGKDLKNYNTNEDYSSESGLELLYSNHLDGYGVYVVLKNISNQEYLLVHSLYGMNSFPGGRYYDLTCKSAFYGIRYNSSLFPSHLFNLCIKCNNLCRQNCPNYLDIKCNAENIKQYYLNYQNKI